MTERRNNNWIIVLLFLIIGFLAVVGFGFLWSTKTECDKPYTVQVYEDDSYIIFHEGQRVADGCIPGGLCEEK